MKTLFTILFLFFAGTAFGQHRDTTRHFVPPIRHADSLPHFAHWDTTKHRDTTGRFARDSARKAHHAEMRAKRIAGYAAMRKQYAARHFAPSVAEKIIAKDSINAEAFRRTHP